MKNKFKYYVYAYLRTDGTPYYIGKGSGNRAFSKNHGRINLPKNLNNIIYVEQNLSEVGAFALERSLIKWYGKKIDNSGILQNITDGGEGSSGLVTVKDSKGLTSMISLDDPRYLSGELIANTKNTVVVIDASNKRFRCDIDDPRYLSGELIPFNTGWIMTTNPKTNVNYYVHPSDIRYKSGELVGLTYDKVPVKDLNGNSLSVSKEEYKNNKSEYIHSNTNKVPVKDKDGNMFSVSIDDPRYLSGELVHHSKGLVTVKDKDGNMFSVSIDDPRYLSGELVHLSSGMVNVYDLSGNIINISKNDPRYLSGELKSIFKGKASMFDVKNQKHIFAEESDLKRISGEYVGSTKKFVKAKFKNTVEFFYTPKKDLRFLTGELIFIPEKPLIRKRKSKF